MRIATLFRSGKRRDSHTGEAWMPRSAAWASTVELLAAYSHSAQVADLRLFHTVALTSPVRAARPSAKRPWSLRERLDKREIDELITAYRNGTTTAASLATTHGVSLRSVKRLLRTAGIRRTTLT
jgi:2,4-dienoyl-CoA reductase-like NADH-dependent reductase (Old Yellow Enzyme family)